MRRPRPVTASRKAAKAALAAVVLFAAVVPLLTTEPALAAAPSAIDLSTYVRVGRYDLPEPTRTPAPTSSVLAQEVSAVTYNWDTDTLFVVGDGGTSIVQVSKTGALIDSMTLATGTSPQGTEFYDTEGLTYVGGGKFVMVEERDRTVVQFTYVAGTTLTRAVAQTVKLGTSIGNIGLEGLSYDPPAGFIVVKESGPLGIFQTAVDFAAGTATNGSGVTVNSVNLFDPALVGTLDFADVFALSNIPSLSGDSSHLLVLSQESGKVVEVDRSGNVSSELTIVTDPGNPLTVPNQQHEGLTMDRDGKLYITSENGGGDFDHPQLWVYEPSAAVNQAPTAVTLTNQVATIAENASTATRLRVADITVTDDAIGVNALTLSGPDASVFEVVSNSLFIKAGTALDFETKSSYAVTVSVDDLSVGSTPDATTSFSLAVTDVVNENPALPSLYISEVAPWSSGRNPLAADWFEVTNTGPNPVSLVGWKMDDNSNVFGLSVALNGVSSIAAGESVIFIESADPAVTTTFRNLWFGSNPPATLQIGTYTGGGVGLSTSGDAVNLFDASGTRQASISFGASPTGPYPTFDNAAALNGAAVTALSAVGIHGAFAASGDPVQIGSPGTVGRLFVSEVAPWSSGNSPLGADWFEVTNTTAQTVSLAGWKMDDSSGSPAAAVALNGVSSIAPGESVIFIESAAPLTAVPAFRNLWFGANPPAALQIGTYTGSGVGLGTGGDAVYLYNGISSVPQAGVTFGASPTGPFPTFDNAAALNGAISTLSVKGINGAFDDVNDLVAVETGSPGRIANKAPTANAGPDQFAIEATGPAGASVTLNGSGSSDPDGDFLVATWTEGAVNVATGTNPTVVLSVGTHTLTVAVSDRIAPDATDTVTVVVVDTTKPVVNVSADQVLEATSPSGAVASYTSSATDVVDGTIVATCVPVASGSTFPIGVTTVTCSATDANTNTGTATLLVTVQDTTKPTITFAGNRTYGILEVVNVTCTATDIASVSVASNCAAPLATGPAYSFGPGTQVVNANATDAAGLTTLASATFAVQATYNDLCTLTKQFATNKKGGELCEVLKEAEKAASKGKLSEKQRKIAEYVKEVMEKSTKKKENLFTQAQAAILISFAKSL